jgi:two-component system phosphate regulon sensor histidine kinase PhoR
MLALAIGSAIALSAIVARVVDRSVEERARERLLRESELLATLIAPHPEVTQTPSEPSPRVRGEGARSADEGLNATAAKSLNARVTIIRADGVVTADSDAETATMENHRNRPEVIAARQSGSGFAVRHSATLGRDLFYLARRINPAGDVVRLALPYDDLRHIESQYEWGARAAIAVVCGLLFLAGSIGVRAIARPIRDVSDAALAVAQGNTAAVPPDHGALEIVELSSAILRMKQSLLAAIARVEAQQRLGAAVFNTLPDGTVVIDSQFRIVDANPRMAELLGTDVHEGQPLVDVLRDRELFAPFEEALQKGTSARATVARPADTTWEVSVHPIAAGEAAAVGIVHDVTPFRRNESMRRRFVADISHELRTPVASIAAAVETLGALHLDEREMRPLVEVVSRQAARMRELLDDLTDLTQIESGQVTLQATAIDVAAIVREVAGDLRVSAEARSIVIEVSGPEHAWIEGDRRRVAQIARNLIDNAVKFSEDGSTVKVAVNGDEQSVVVGITDSGEGIPTKELTRIFQRFYQVDRSRSKLRPGSGLGLAIVKHLAQLHHAEVEVDSAVGVGSTFRVRFPRLTQEVS